jgi:hypothetical protein
MLGDDIYLGAIWDAAYVVSHSRYYVALGWSFIILYKCLCISTGSWALARRLGCNTWQYKARYSYGQCPHCDTKPNELLQIQGCSHSVFG